MTVDYDIVIAGAGAVGAALACALDQTGLRVAVLAPEALAFEPPAAIHPWVSALTLASQRLLGALDAWQLAAGRGCGGADGNDLSRRACPFSNMRVWDAGGWGEIHFDAAELGQPQLGWIAENALIQKLLWRRIAALGRVELLCPAKLVTADFEPHRVRVRLADGRDLSARLLVAADGARSKVRSLAGIRSRRWDYHQRAIVAAVSTEQPHQHTAWQRFLPTGPVAFLPLADGRCSVVWSIDDDLTEPLMELTDAAFAERLADAFGWRLGTVVVDSERLSFPLQALAARQYVKPRLALVGDAAHVVHPLAGQGANLGLMDAAALAEVIAAAVKAGRDDPGALTTLRRYERWRKGENMLVLRTLDGFQRLFGNDRPAARWLRNTGLNMANVASPVKRLLARQAMGLSGELPALACDRY